MGDVRLSDLGGIRPIPEWRVLSWADCDDCGAAPLSTADENEWVYDGEPVVCLDCGQVGRTSVDEVGAHVSWSDNYLRPSALAGFRRLWEVSRAR